jgi:nucleoside phosphorylase
MSGADQYGPVRSYFSHSYSRDDRDLNLFFWRLFSAEGFRFCVDPKSKLYSTVYLEWMMARSACFTAVIPLRRGEPLLCSPFQRYEIGLAMRSRKPMIVFVEEGVASASFSPKLRTIPFNRNTLHQDEAEFAGEIKKVSERSSPYRRDVTMLLEDVGILKSGTAASDAFDVDMVERAVRASGFRPAVIDCDGEVANQIILGVGGCQAIVAPSADLQSLSWVLALIHGRSVPCLRLAKDGVIVQSPELRGNELEWPGVGGAEVVRWTDAHALDNSLRTHLGKLSGPQIEFGTFQQGEAYFRSIGRQPVKVFISNSHEDNEFAISLTEALKRENFDVFHYRASNKIPIGDRWAEGLLDQIAASRFFVPLITKAYGESGECKREFDAAVGLDRRSEFRIFPYTLNRDGGPLLGSWNVRYQAGDLAGKSTTEMINQIVADLDKVREEGEMSPVPPPPPIDFDRADIAIITMLEEEYRAACAILENGRPPRVKTNEVSQYAPEIGEVRARDGTYKVVVCLIAKQTPTNAAIATGSIVRRWKPRYVIGVGVAGGLPREQLGLGDVVVSSVIFGYEYGKMEEDFSPRMDYTYQVDGALLAAASAVASSGWRDHITVPKPSGNGETKMRPGAIASGDKVVDSTTSPYFQAVLEKWPKLLAVEMEGAGVAAAINALKDGGASEYDSHVGFLMVRGISDMIRTKPATEPVAGQTAERDNWKPYASAAAANFVAELIRRRWPVAPTPDPPPGGEDR